MSLVTSKLHMLKSLPAGIQMEFRKGGFHQIASQSKIFKLTMFMYDLNIILPAQSTGPVGFSMIFAATLSSSSTSITCCPSSIMAVNVTVAACSSLAKHRNRYSDRGKSTPFPASEKEKKTCNQCCKHTIPSVPKECSTCRKLGIKSTFYFIPVLLITSSIDLMLSLLQLLVCAAFTFLHVLFSFYTVW